MKSRPLYVGQFAASLCCLVLLATTSASAESPAPANALRNYIAKPDSSYSWKVQSRGSLGKTTYTELRLVSQTWKDIVWKHQMFVITPTSVSSDHSHGLFFVGGSRWKKEFDSEDFETKVPSEAALFAQLAERMKSPVTVLLQVPHQPILGDKYEDQIIAYTFEQFLKTNDAEWPLLLPMVKSAVRGMDATQAFLKEEKQLDIKTFTVTGASKRGWTTWLTSASDSRVTALAPMVIDMLGMKKQMAHQKEAWGKPSHMIDDYTKRGLLDALETDRGAALMSIVDPHRYLPKIKQPKLIVLGTNDQYWPLDALNLYWDDVKGPKYILYVPNRGHSVSDYTRLMGSLNGINQHAATGRALPKLNWKYEPTNAGVELKIDADKTPKKVQVWIATSDSRDFREAKWRSTELEAADGTFTYALDAPPTQYAAMFGECIFENVEWPLYLSTTVRILSPQAKPQPSE